MGSCEDPLAEPRRHQMKANRREGGVRPSSAAADRLEPPAQEEGPVKENTPQRLLSVGAAADYLGVSRATVERLVFRGELPVIKVGGSTRYDVEDLDGFIAINRSRNRRRTA